MFIFQIAFPLVLLSTLASLSHASSYCSGYDKVQKTSIYGDALSDSPDCLDRDGKAYPRYVNRLSQAARPHYKFLIFQPRAQANAASIKQIVSRQ